MKREGFRRFYTSQVWRQTAHGYMASVSGLCERCLAKGIITPAAEVHHKIRLTPEALSDPEISLAWRNLEALCKRCHMDEHDRVVHYRIDASGHIVEPEPRGRGV